MGVAGGVAAGTAVAGVAGSAISASAQSSAASKAAAQEQAGYLNASGVAGQNLSNISTALSPYTTLGTTATGSLTNALTADQTGTGYIGQSGNYLTDASNNYANAGGALSSAAGYNTAAAGIYNTLQNGISQQTLDNTPGYQFTLGQGLESTQNSAAARGLANSGAALKGAATYATGLANDTYQNQYQDLLSTATGYSGLANNELGAASGYNTSASGETAQAGTSLNQQASLLDTNTQNYNQLLQGSQLGENAANAYGEYATQTAAAQEGAATGTGTAQAAGSIGQANAITNGASGVSSSLTQALLLNKLLGTSTGPGGGTNTASGYQFPTDPYSTGYTTLPSS